MNCEDKKKDKKKESSKTIIENIIIISPVSNVYKKLEKMSKNDGIEISTICEKIIEEYVSK